MPLLYECISWLVLLLLAQWTFGNLYEAVVIVPNALSLIESKSRTGEALFPTKKASPAAYYVPPSSLGLVLILVLVVNGLLHHRPGTPYVLTACGLLLAGAGLTLYIVRHISLELFFKQQTDSARVRKLLNVWIKLNYIRLTIGCVSVFFVILWIRTTLKPS